MQPLAVLCRAADDVELHEVGGAANAHGCASDDADDVAFPNEAFFEEAFFGDGGKTIDFLDVRNVARHDAPDEGHAAAGFAFG